MSNSNIDKKTGFTVVNNDYLNDTELSMAARGMLTTLLSLKGIAHWNFSIKGLAAILPDSERQIAKALNELEKKGYLVRKRLCSKGKFFDWEYVISDKQLSEEVMEQSFKKNKKINIDPAIVADEVPVRENVDDDKLNNTNETPHHQNADVAFSNMHNANDNQIHNEKYTKQCFNIDSISLTETPKVNMPEMIDTMETYKDIIKDNISYDYLCDCEDVDEVNGIVDVITDVVCSDEGSKLRVAKRDMPVSVVKSMFLKLREHHIQYVLANLRKTSTEIKNIKSYLITSLYNAMHTYQLHLNADVRNCLRDSETFVEPKPIY